MLTHILSGLGKLPEAVEFTVDRANHGAINPARVDLH
jgi:hypothetical protein